MGFRLPLQLPIVATRLFLQGSINHDGGYGGACQGAGKLKSVVAYHEVNDEINSATVAMGRNRYRDTTRYDSVGSLVGNESPSDRRE